MGKRYKLEVSEMGEKIQARGELGGEEASYV
jgi:hypothetical protein